MPVLGIDFDNTIVCYDRIFHKVAREKGLIPDTVAENKNAVRDYLRSVDREAAWTELQGYVYGSRMPEADPFPHVKESIQRCLDAGWQVRIISHKTKRPFLGEQYDLHAAARSFLEAHGFFSELGLKAEEVFFELTKEEKVRRIASERCDWFVDDLPEILLAPGFPEKTKPVLFDPASQYLGPKSQERLVCLGSWRAIQHGLLGNA